MRSKALLLIGVATVCGMIASIVIGQLTGRPSLTNARSSVRQRIYVAQYDIAPGRTLSEDNLRLESWQVDSVPPDALLRLEDALGKVCRGSLQRGEPIQVNALTVPAAKTPPAVSTVAAPVPHAPVPHAVVPHAPVHQTPASPPSIAQAPAPETLVPAPPSVPAAASTAKKPIEAVAESAEPAAKPAVNGATIGLSPPAVTATGSRGDREPTRFSAAPSADQNPDATAETREPTLQTTRRKAAAPANASATGFITDEGWVMTIYKSGGVKVLRWRPTNESSAAEPRGASVEQSARPISDPRKS